MIQLRKGGKPTRDAAGRVLGGDLLSKNRAGNQLVTTSTGRVQPDRRWFGNTRVVGAKELDTFREAMAARMNDPYSVVLRAKTLPTGLLVDAKTAARANLLTAESYEDTFGGKRGMRKRVKLGVGDLAELAQGASAAATLYANASDGADRDRVDIVAGDRATARESVLEKGQSKRLWGELFKVLDCRCASGEAALSV